MIRRVHTLHFISLPPHPFPLSFQHFGFLQMPLSQFLRRLKQAGRNHAIENPLPPEGEVAKLRTEVQHLCQRLSNSKRKSTVPSAQPTLHTQKHSSVQDLCGFSKEVFICHVFIFHVRKRVSMQDQKIQAGAQGSTFLNPNQLRQGITDRVLSMMFDLELCSKQNNFKRSLAITHQKCKSIIWPSKEHVQAFNRPVSGK